MLKPINALQIAAPFRADSTIQQWISNAAIVLSTARTALMLTLVKNAGRDILRTLDPKGT
jgi:hypothetical protein